MLVLCFIIFKKKKKMKLRGEGTLVLNKVDQLLL